jgi:hypothetical protein
VSAWHGVALWTARGSGPRERVCKHKHRTEVAAMDCALVFVRSQIGRALHGDPHADHSQFAQYSAFARKVPR